MQIKPEQLRTHLKNQLLLVYMVCGDEPLQHRESVDMLRKAAHYYGFTEREVYTAEAGFDWHTLSFAASELSLFAAQRLIELHMPTGRPSDKGESLIEYCQNPPQGVLLLIVAGKVEAATKKSKWYKALDKVAGIVNVWPINGTYLNQWLNQRLRSKGLALQADAIQLIADRVEGNLLAADQEIEKLSLLYPAADQMLSLSTEQVVEAVFDSARYNVFDLFDCALSKDLKRALKILAGLRSEGESIILLMTLIAKEVRMLARMTAIRQKQDLEAAMKPFYLFPKRKSLISQTVRTTEPEYWQGLLEELLELDKMAKGATAGEPWDKLQLILAQIAGQSVLEKTGF